jgi:hypothetical protein
MGDEPNLGGWLPPRPPSHPDAAGSARPARRPAAGGYGPDRPRRRAPSSALSTWSLTSGIAGLGLLLLTLGAAAPLSLLLSAAAWACATIERRRAAALDPQHPLPARSGRLLGITGVVLGLLALMLWAALLLSGASFQDVLEGWREELEREQRQRSLGV